MMGKHKPQKDLFNYGVVLGRGVRVDHPLRKVVEKVDFGFVREPINDCCVQNGNESVDPRLFLN